MKILLKKSSNSSKKYMVIFEDGTKVHFGAAGYSDFTKHKDVERKQRYISRHSANENWGKSGIKTAGFWARWLLWNKPTIASSISDIENRFNVTIRRSL